MGERSDSPYIFGCKSSSSVLRLLRLPSSARVVPRSSARSPSPTRHRIRLYTSARRTCHFPVCKPHASRPISYPVRASRSTLTTTSPSSVPLPGPLFFLRACSPGNFTAHKLPGARAEGGSALLSRVKLNSETRRSDPFPETTLLPRRSRTRLYMSERRNRLTSINYNGTERTMVTDFVKELHVSVGTPIVTLLSHRQRKMHLGCHFIPKLCSAVLAAREILAMFDVWSRE